jgi:hypothetical protein
VDFNEYLKSKKIDPVAFRQAEPARWTEWNAIFEQVSPASFTAQKLYLINPVRRKFPLPLQITEPNAGSESMPATPKPARPVFKPKIK